MLVFARGERWGMGKMGEGDLKVQTWSYKINKSWDVKYSMVIMVYNVTYLKIIKRVDLKSSHHKKKMVAM